MEVDENLCVPIDLCLPDKRRVGFGYLEAKMHDGMLRPRVIIVHISVPEEGL